MQRDTRFSSNDYFLKLSQLSSGEANKAPKLDKRIFGGSFGGPVLKDRLFFFGNYERLQEDSETPVLRNIPSMTMRDGVLVYPCADPGQCPAAIGVGAQHDSQHPGRVSRDDAGRAGGRGSAAYRSEPRGDRRTSAATRSRTTPASTASTWWATGLPRRSRTRSTRRSAAWTIEPGAQSFFGRLNFQNDAVATAPQFPGQPSRNTREVNEPGRGARLGRRALLDSS